MSETVIINTLENIQRLTKFKLQISFFPTSLSWQSVTMWLTPDDMTELTFQAFRIREGEKNKAYRVSQKTFNITDKYY